MPCPALYGPTAAKSAAPVLKHPTMPMFQVLNTAAQNLCNVNQSSVEKIEVLPIRDQNGVTHCGPCHSLLFTDGSNMARPALYGPTAAKSVISTRKPAKSNGVPGSCGNFGRFLESGPKFSSVNQSTRRTGPKYSDTPWTLPLIAAHDSSNMACSALHGPMAAKSAKSARKPAKSNDVARSGSKFRTTFGKKAKVQFRGPKYKGTGPKYSDTPWTLPLIAAN
jgi:hypothetical protein